MATSSIVKEFVVKEANAFRALVVKMNRVSARNPVVTESPALAKGETH